MAVRRAGLIVVLQGVAALIVAVVLAVRGIAGAGRLGAGAEGNGAAAFLPCSMREST